MANTRPFKEKQIVNTHGVTAPVRPRKIAQTKNFDQLLESVTKKHRVAIKSLASR